MGVSKYAYSAFGPSIIALAPCKQVAVRSSGYVPRVLLMDAVNANREIRVCQESSKSSIVPSLSAFLQYFQLFRFYSFSIESLPVGKYSGRRIHAMPVPAVQAVKSFLFFLAAFLKRYVLIHDNLQKKCLQYSHVENPGYAVRHQTLLMDFSMLPCLSESCPVSLDCSGEKC